MSSIPKKFNKISIWETPFHTLLLGAYPVLALYTINSKQTTFSATISSFTISAFVIILLFALSFLSILFWTSISSWKALVKVVTVVIAMGVSYYMAYIVLKNSLLNDIARHRFLFPVWMTALAAITMYILKPKIILANLKNPSNLERAAAITSITLLLFFSYGHVSGIMSEGEGFGRIMETHRRLGALWIVLLVVGIFTASKMKDIGAFTKGANVMTGALCIMAISQVVFSAIQHPGVKAASNTPKDLSTVSTSDPDVYYIVLDAYSRADLLQEVTGFDNSEFINEMKAMGFILPACTQSNYHATLPSLTSTLNMNYLDKLPPNQQYLPNYYDYIPYLQQNLVMRIFKERGYETYTFKGRFEFLNMVNSSHYYDLFAGDSNRQQIDSQNFLFIFLETTALRPALDYVDHYKRATDDLPSFLKSLILTDDIFSNRFYKQYQKSLYHLDILEQIPDMPGKKFVYAHLYITHEPYVFTAEGDFRWPEAEGPQGYLDQILFVNKSLPKILQSIIVKSEIPPIIVVQGDHGWTWDERRNRILSAYYLPNGGSDMLYDGISPVNTFRIIMNKYFGGNYELLPDVSYYAKFKDEDMDNLKISQDTCSNKIGTQIHANLR
ncbi:MAG: hypothetical protein HY865_05180 [Chloroflexi bacterium]|nr:hypothetical protein [Chloroflexota bacterium]